MNAPSSTDQAIPTFGSVVLDCPDPMALAGFYARLLDWPEPADDDWVTLTGPGATFAFQRVDGYRAPNWPAQDVPQQFHLDLSVADLPAAHRRAVELGARLVDDADQGFWVYLDPAGHPFCLCG